MKNLKFLSLATVICIILANPISLEAVDIDDLSSHFDNAIAANDLNEISDLIGEASHIEGGVNAVHKAGSPKTPLFEAVKKDKREIIRLLIEAGADFNQQIGPVRISPLHLAATHHKSDAVRALIEYGGDELNLEITNARGTTPLQWARANAPEIAQILQDEIARRNEAA